MPTITTIKLQTTTRDRLRTYEDYKKQTFNDMIIALLNALDKHETEKQSKQPIAKSNNKPSIYFDGVIQ